MAPWVTRIGARSAASPWRTGSIAGVALLMAKPNGANVCPKKKQSRRGIDQRTVQEMGQARAAPPAGPTEEGRCIGRLASWSTFALAP